MCYWLFLDDPVNEILDYFQFLFGTRLTQTKILDYKK